MTTLDKQELRAETARMLVAAARVEGMAKFIGTLGPDDLLSSDVDIIWNRARIAAKTGDKVAQEVFDWANGERPGQFFAARDGR